MLASIQQSEERFVILLLLLSCGLLLPQLGDQCLNGEEATVALLAERILRFGIPRAQEVWLPWLARVDANNRHFVPDCRSYVIEYAKELWQMPKGPIDRVVDYLYPSSRQGVEFFTSVEAEPLIFHRRWQAVRRLPFDRAPDAIILQSGWLNDYDRVLVDSAWGARPAKPYRVSWQRAPIVAHMHCHYAYVQSILSGHGYRKALVHRADHWKQNSDETRTRYYCPDEGLKEVTIWLRHCGSLR